MKVVECGNVDFERNVVCGMKEVSEVNSDGDTRKPIFLVYHINAPQANV